MDLKLSILSWLTFEVNFISGFNYGNSKMLYTLWTHKQVVGQQIKMFGFQRATVCWEIFGDILSRKHKLLMYLQQIQYMPSGAPSKISGLISLTFTNWSAAHLFHFPATKVSRCYFRSQTPRNKKSSSNTAWKPVIFTVIGACLLIAAHIHKHTVHWNHSTLYLSVG